MVPFYVGLIGALLMLAVKVVQKLVADVPALLEQSVSDTIFTVLSLILGSLLVTCQAVYMGVSSDEMRSARRTASPNFTKPPGSAGGSARPTVFPGGVQTS